MFGKDRLLLLLTDKRLEHHYILSARQLSNCFMYRILLWYFSHTLTQYLHIYICISHSLVNSLFSCTTSFLDKVYCLSSPEAMEKFLKNPRPYLLPAQPRPPAKISVIGAPYSGKTTFCHLLAQKYGAKVRYTDVLLCALISEGFSMWCMNSPASKLTYGCIDIWIVRVS